MKTWFCLWALYFFSNKFGTVEYSIYYLVRFLKKCRMVLSPNKIWRLECFFKFSKCSLSVFHCTYHNKEISWRNIIEDLSAGEIKNIYVLLLSLYQTSTSNLWTVIGSFHYRLLYNYTPDYAIFIMTIGL